MEPSVIEMPESATADIEVTPLVPAASARHAGTPFASVFQTLFACPDPEATTPAEVALFAATEIAGVVPPLLAIGAVPDTLVTPAELEVPAPIAVLTSAAVNLSLV